MSVVVGICPLCRSTSHETFESLMDQGHDIHYRLCTNCGLVFQSPRMSEGELDEYYQAEYRLRVQGSEGPSAKDQFVQKARAIHLVDFCDGVIDYVDMHLDIGSSTGELLLAFQRKYNCGSYGVEPGDAYRTFSRERGLNVYKTLDDLRDRRFDLISMSHVLEHLHDPVDYLHSLREERITSNGFLLLEVPNLFGHHSFEVSHLYAYSRMVLEETLMTAGFNPILTRTHGKPRSRLMRLYLTILAEAGMERMEGVQPRQFFPSVRMRRKAGMTWAHLATRLAPSLAWLPVPGER